MGSGASTKEDDPIENRKDNEHDKVWQKSNLRKRTVRHIQKILEEKKRKSGKRSSFRREERERERKESEARRSRKPTSPKRKNIETNSTKVIVNENRRPIPPSSVEREEKIEDDLLPPPPEHIRTSNITPTTCDVYWRPPPVQHVRRAARNFILQLKNVKTKRVRVAYYGPAWDHQLTHLEPRSLYSIRIACDNMHGAGEFSPYQAFRTIRLSGVKSNNSSPSKKEDTREKKRRRTSKTLLTKDLRLKRFRLMRALNPESTINRKNIPHVVLDIKRDALLESSLRQLQSISQISWEQHPIRIEYLGEEGKGPGVNRDWYLQFSRQVFSSCDALGMFLPSGRTSTHALGGDEAKHVPLLKIDISSTWSYSLAQLLSRQQQHILGTQVRLRNTWSCGNFSVPFWQNL